MARIATEALNSGTVSVRSRPQPMLVRFFVFDGATRVVVEADNEDDAVCLCREMRWDFLCFCND